MRSRLSTWYDLVLRPLLIGLALGFLLYQVIALEQARGRRRKVGGDVMTKRPAEILSIGPLNGETQTAAETMSGV